MAGRFCLVAWRNGPQPTSIVEVLGEDKKKSSPEIDGLFVGNLGVILMQKLTKK